MKKLLPVMLAVLLSGLYSQTFAQAKQFAFIEHFTNTSCAPCAQQNPFMEATLDENFGRYHQISYHTWWPGPTDPMYTANKPDNHFRTTYYGVNAVPDVYLLGNTQIGSPTGVTQSLIDNTTSVSSPMRIRVQETSSGLTRTAKITVYTLGEIPASPNYKIHACVAEKYIHYNTAPGSNGEKNFYNVMRKLLPDSIGASFTVPAVGDSATVTYTYTLDYTHWDTTQIYTIAFVQNNNTKWVINSGSSLDPDVEFVPMEANFKKGQNGDTKTFAYKLYNLGASAQNIRMIIGSDIPNDWDASFTVNGNTYADSVNLSIPGKSTWDLVVTVGVGATAALAKTAITMKLLDHPEFAPVSLTSNLISGVNELIINNDAGWGDGSGLTAQSFQQNYISGLNYAGAAAFAVTDLTTFKSGYNNDCMTGVQIYYYNVGWSFPALTDPLVAIFTSELNAGKRLLISGQDIGWDVYTASSSGGHTTPATKAFYNNFLGAIFNNDGSTANSQYIANTADSVFGAIPTSTLVNVYGGSNFFPDEISKTGNGTETFYYNTTKTKKGGVRATNGTWKTVYLAASLEMISDSMVRKAIIKQAHIWFGGTNVGIRPGQSAPAEYMSQNYPNPSGESTTVLLNSIEKGMSLQVMDYLGRIVYTENLSEGEVFVNIPVASLSSGLYFYSLTDGNRVLQTRRMQVVH